MVLTFLSDLGLRDVAVAGAKAAWMQSAPDVEIVDISHNVAQYDIHQGAYLLSSAYRHFPKGTVHIAAVDVFAGNTPALITAEVDGHFIIAPDNGLLPLAFGTKATNIRLAHEFSRPYGFNGWIQQVGKIMETIAKGGGIGSFPEYQLKKSPALTRPQVTPTGIDCNVLHIDRYGNVVLDISRQQFEELVNNKPFRIRLMRLKDITLISNHYGDVKQGEPLCRFNSAGFLEVAINHENAATLLGLGTYSTGNLRYQTIKIFI
jgi:S-adenosylmethionine hydrolase